MYKSDKICNTKQQKSTIYTQFCTPREDEIGLFQIEGK